MMSYRVVMYVVASKSLIVLWKTDPQHSQPPIELQHRRQEISTLAFNGNSHSSITADLESGFGGDAGKVSSP
jgi:hypothetical protein